VNPPTPIAYSADLREELTVNISAHGRRTHPLDGRKHAAVAIVVVDSTPGDTAVDTAAPTGLSMKDVPGDTTGFDTRMIGVSGGAAFVLCRRASRLNRHAGQWALPGGRLDPGERPVDAALRELDEELGVRLDESSVLGVLDDYPTRSGYIISPFELWAPDDAEPVANPEEVASVHRVAIRELCRDPRFVAIPESDRPVIQVPVGGDLIHAPTGAIIHQFRVVAYEGAADVRVDGYEQPVFAWR
jgi:8-oxo-dGTP pyrophosphatase MutT (NUDIX family)